MKNLIYFIFILLVCVIFNISCDSQFLNQKPTSEISEQDFWKDPTLVKTYTNGIYNGMGHGLGVWVVKLSSLVDESHFIHNQGTKQIVQSTITPGSMGAFTNGRLPEYAWTNLYSSIRKTNILLKRIKDSPIENKALKQRAKGEAHFLRAYFYHNLVRFFGGVPIVTKVYKLSDDFFVKRDSFKDCINFIVEEADSAAAVLPLKYSGENVGRATKGAALALKSRILLYAASDLYANPRGSHPELTGYTSGSQNERWQKAKDAAKAVMDLDMYNLYKGNPAHGDSIAKNYTDLFLTKTNSEKILQRYFVRKRDDTPNFGLWNGPNGFHNWAGNTPIQELVDDYQMKDGSKFDWNKPKESARPYKNRDPRFYATIAYNGAKWRERPKDVQDIDPEGVIQTAKHEEKVNGEIKVINGLDTREGPVETWNGSYSGYYLRKFMNAKLDGRFKKQEVPWPFFRYGEILLNYAEASIELGEDADARRTLNKIRKRAGMPEFSSAVMGQDLMEQYRNERRIEMAFEEQRYFDVRRWMIAPKVLDRDAHGIDIYGKLNNDGSHTYKYSIKQIQKRSWDNKMYFKPIPLDEMERNKKLIQNPGY